MLARDFLVEAVDLFVLALELVDDADRGPT